MKTKECTKCGEHKPITNQYWNKKKNRKYGLTTECKICLSKRHREYKRTKKGREYNVKYSREWRRKNPEKWKALQIKSYKKRMSDKEKLLADSIKKKEYREKNKDKLLLKDYEKRLLLKDHYIATCLKSSVKDLPVEIIEIKRNIIKLKRELNTK